ncbi:UNKNOWN [Stylonychia lemnae]|uniref:NADAR domain-containing protein n=1 Tax=Stylonychia lemnae TaxID=5949 RepID=A0A077ZQU0_STYLE|nr:UNKNOWN [Stylonychia lemnae]|eukprot:CDW71755.1 UNKNOWN [Stylonychia lemnae]
MKFPDYSYSEEIRKATTPNKAKKLGNSKRHFIYEDWDERRIKVMYEGLKAKFNQNLDLQKSLLALRGRTLVEHTARDSFWGDGGDMAGVNMLGQLLMQVRDELINDKNQGIIFEES